MVKNSLKKKKNLNKRALMNFIALTLISAFLFAFTFYCRQQAGKFLAPSAALTLEVIAEFAVLSIAFFFLSPSGGISGLIKHVNGIPFAIIGGISIGVGVYLNFLALKTGFLSKVTSITSPSQIVFGIMLGVLLAGESFTLKQTIGAAISIIGILLTVIK